jgi:hypothetical protein
MLATKIKAKQNPNGIHFPFSVDRDRWENRLSDRLSRFKNEVTLFDRHLIRLISSGQRTRA